MGYISNEIVLTKARVSTPISEKELLRGLATNNRQAIETIYREHYAIVQAYILKNNGYPEDARDVFQEAMVVLYEKSKSDEFELTCLIRTYIYSVCRRLWLKRLQQLNRYSPGVEGIEEIIAVEEELDNHEQKNADLILMESALSKIGEPCKSLLEAFYIHKKRMQEIADQFGYTNSENAKTQKYKCLLRLKKLFFAQYKNGN